LGTAQADIPSAENKISRVVNQVSEAVTKKDLHGFSLHYGYPLL